MQSTYLKEHKHELVQLTALRGFAALWVVMLHYTMYLLIGQRIDIVLLGPVINKGYLGVDIFFMLSGYVLAYQYTSRFSNQISTSQYFIYLKRRLVRIYPLYMFTLFLILLLDVTNILTPFVKKFGDYSYSSFLLSAIMMQSWGIRSTWSWNIPSWSVSVEWFLYLVFPLIIRHFYAFNAKVLVLTYIGLTLALACWLHFFPQSLFYGAMHFALVRGLIEFTMGIVFFCIGLKFRTSIWFPHNSFFFSSVALLIFSLYCCQEQIVWVAFCGLIVCVMPMTTGHLKKVLTSKPLIFLGNISYSIYLLQFAVQIIYNQLFTQDYGNLNIVIFIFVSA